ncbi:MAG: DUF11 domain-containing protein [Thermoleophilia bacterium]|nr:DUF11 domain-containing protein [Thermoleophilia bacterium]
MTCQKPGLSVTKTPDAQNINAGEDVVFTVQVDNAGPGTAKGVTVSDTLPAGTAGAWVEDPDNPDCEIAGGVLNCDFGDLAAGASESVTVKAPTDGDNCGVYDNTASYTAGNAPNGSDDGQVTCLQPNLSVTKTGNGNIKAGEDVVFTIQVSNAGPGVAKNVALTDDLPSGIAGDLEGNWEITNQPAGDPCAVTVPIAGNTLTCDFGDLAANASVSVTVRAATDNAECTTYDNTATASPTNGSGASDSDTVVCTQIKPDIVLKKKANKKTVRPGNKVKYTITVKNTKKGSVAKNLKVCDKLPSQMTVVKKGKKAYFDNGKLCWNVKRLPYSKNGKSFSYTAKVNNNTNPGAKLKNVVTVGNKKATQTVRVKRPKVINRPKRVPVTG